jgi:hypothetical protein
MIGMQLGIFPLQSPQFDWITPLSWRFPGCVRILRTLLAQRFPFGRALFATRCHSFAWLSSVVIPRGKKTALKHER